MRWGHWKMMVGVLGKPIRLAVKTCSKDLVKKLWTLPGSRQASTLVRLKLDDLVSPRMRPGVDIRISSICPS